MFFALFGFSVECDESHCLSDGSAYSPGGVLLGLSRLSPRSHVFPDSSSDLGDYLGEVPVPSVGPLSDIKDFLRFTRLPPFWLRDPFRVHISHWVFESRDPTQYGAGL